MLGKIAGCLHCVTGPDWQRTGGGGGHSRGPAVEMRWCSKKSQEFVQLPFLLDY